MSDLTKRSRTRNATIATAIALLCLLVPAGGVALADFGDPGTDPTESPRLNTPNDPEFDRCEEDDPDEGCGSYFNEQFGSFGFNPDWTAASTTTS